MKRIASIEAIGERAGLRGRYPSDNPYEDSVTDEQQTDRRFSWEVGRRRGWARKEIS